MRLCVVIHLPILFRRDRDHKTPSSSPIHATKDPDTWVLGQRTLRSEKRASLKLRPKRWEMFVVERGVVRFVWDSVDTRVDGDNVTNILQHHVVPRAVCPLSQETAAGITVYAGRTSSRSSVPRGHIVGGFGGQPVAPKRWIDCDSVHIAQGCGVIASPGDDRFE